MKLALFAAFPHELKYILKGINVLRVLRHDTFTLFPARCASHEIIAVQTGMGERNAKAALDYVLTEHRPGSILSVGFGGALYHGALIGDLVWADRFFFIPQSGAGIRSIALPESANPFAGMRREPGIRKGCIITVEKRMRKCDIEKVLPRGLRSPVCDMENFPLAELSLEKGLPFAGIRSITDRAYEDIPTEFYRVTDRTGCYRASRALGIFLRSPHLIPHGLKLGRYSDRAAKSLWHAVKVFLEAAGKGR